MNLVNSISTQVLIDLTPPTSLEVPMFGQYLITTMVTYPDTVHSSVYF